MVAYLEMISAIISVVGTLLVINKNKNGFLIWVVGNTLWTVYGIITRQYFFLAQYIIYTVISIFGFIKWLKEDKKSKSKK
jgi:nicotinamide mononucleotide transporter PnuC